MTYNKFDAIDLLKYFFLQNYYKFWNMCKLMIEVRFGSYETPLLLAVILIVVVKYLLSYITFEIVIVSFYCTPLVILLYNVIYCA